jgi:hypothetical protein
MAMFPTHIAEDPDEARARSEPAWDYWRSLLAPELAASTAIRPGMGLSVESMTYDYVVAERHVPFGSVENALATARWVESLGVTHLGLTFHFGGIDHAALRAIELWGHVVTCRGYVAHPTEVTQRAGIRDVSRLPRARLEDGTVHGAQRVITRGFHRSVGVRHSESPAAV